MPVLWQLELFGKLLMLKTTKRTAKVLLQESMPDPKLSVVSLMTWDI
jgi:hypothetical protein